MRKSYTAEFKAKVALEATKGDKHYYEALSNIEGYISYYNEERRHSSIGNCTPKEAYLSGRKMGNDAA